MIARERFVFVFSCSLCGRVYYSKTNTLPQFAQSEHFARYHCAGLLRPDHSELAGNPPPNCQGTFGAKEQKSGKRLRK